MIKGRPCVHDDDDLIVSHIAVTVSNMMEFKQRLAKLNVVWRKNVSVPNPAESDTGIVEQVYINIGVILKIKVIGLKHQKLHL